jgi:uncharacterized integral membrane protein
MASSESTERRQKSRPTASQVLGAIIAVVAVVFIAENGRKTKIRFIGPEATTWLWLALLVAAALGFVVGILEARHKRKWERITCHCCSAVGPTGAGVAMAHESGRHEVVVDPHHPVIARQRGHPVLHPAHDVVQGIVRADGRGDCGHGYLRGKLGLL